MRTVATRRRSRFVLFVLSLVAVTLITLDSRNVPVFTTIRNVAADTFAPVGGAFDWATTPLRNAWDGVTGYWDLKNQNDRLRRQLDALKSKQITGVNAQEQLRRLNEQLQLGFGQTLPSQLARVTSGPFSNFSSYRLELDKAAIRAWRSACRW